MFSCFHGLSFFFYPHWFDWRFSQKWAESNFKQKMFISSARNWALQLNENHQQISNRWQKSHFLFVFIDEFIFIIFCIVIIFVIYMYWITAFFANSINLYEFIQWCMHVNGAIADVYRDNYLHTENVFSSY